MWVTFKRVIKSGFKNFWRNGWLSTATIGVMVLTLMTISVLLMFNIVATGVLGNIQ